MFKGHQATAFDRHFGTGIPSSNLLSSYTSCSSSGALSFRNRSSATINSCQMSAVARLKPLGHGHGSRTEVNGLSTTLVVRRCRLCFSEKS